ncbi:MAG TPA: sugar ABC transporter ATP-binding protein [Actinomycetes bacterium]|nr:sugar ABC transporter ATP-binding protein [Actinomycetes bacterium]
MTSAAADLEVRSLTKKYAGIAAVQNVNALLPAGQVHALVGANGAGKSTLIKMLSGVTRPTSGQILLGGQELVPRGPLDALKAGIATIQQDVAVAPDLTVAENILLGREPSPGLPGFVSRRRASAVAEAILGRLGVDLAPDARVETLSHAQRGLVSIARALAFDCQVLILDEPTASLSHEAAEHLHAVIRDLRDQGKTIIYVSHRLDDVLALAQTVTVLRDGRQVALLPRAEVTLDRVIRLMTGGVDLAARASGHEPIESDGGPALVARSIAAAPHFTDVSLAVRAGEVLGIAGFIGSGREEVVAALAGALRLTGGAIEVSGQAVRLGSPERALRHGIQLLPGDRAGGGLGLGQSIRSNVMLPPSGEVARWGIRRLRRERMRCAELLQQVGCVPADPERPAGHLSGGNQQRVLMARALHLKRQILLVENPTQGVDIKGKSEIHQLILDLAATGMAVVVSSAEIDELESLCHRILVMRGGAVVGDLPVGEFDSHRLLQLASSA